MPGSPDAGDATTDVAHVELPCGSFDVLRAVHFCRRFPPHFHDTFAIGVVEAGLTRIRTRRGEWTAGPRAILAFSPGEIHGAEPLTASGYTFRMIYPPADVVHDAGADRRHGWRDVPLFREPVIADGSLGRELYEAHVCLTSGSARAPAESLLLASLRRLVERHGANRPPVDDGATPTDTELVRQAQEFLHDRCTGRVRLSELAVACRLSPFQTIRVFRRVLGVPPFAYLLQVRVNRAQALLREGSSLAQAAYASGFSDQSHLTRAFKRVVGVPPGQYARSVRVTAA